MASAAREPLLPHHHQHPNHGSDSSSAITVQRTVTSGSGGAVVFEEEEAAPLVAGFDAAGGEQGDTFKVCSFNLAKVILGAGMMAFPKVRGVR